MKPIDKISYNNFFGLYYERSAQIGWIKEFFQFNFSKLKVACSVILYCTDVEKIKRLLQKDFCKK